MFMDIKTLSILLAGFSTVSAAICSNGKTVGNAACCQLFPLLADLQENLFDSPCNEPVREVLHLAFHDAMGFSLSKGAVAGHGSDGSIITFASKETIFPENTALVGVIGWVTPLIARHNISDGDFLHFAAAVGIATCPGGPRPKFLLGRPQASAPAVSGLVPNASDSVTTILARFADVGINPPEIVALLASHSVGANYATDAVIPGAPFDTTPGIFDTQIFTEVLLPGVLFPGNGSNVGEVLSPLRGEVRLQSDFEIARDSRTACAWKSLVGNQALMQNQFANALAKLSAIGQNTAAMIDCSDVIPIPAPVKIQPLIPQGFTSADIEDACPSVQLPALETLPGPAPTVNSATCWNSAEDNCWRHTNAKLNQPILASQCTTGPIQCCNQFEDDMLDASILLNFLAVAPPANLNFNAAFDCHSLPGIGNGSSCLGEALCCPKLVSAPGNVTVGVSCTPIVLGV